MYVQIAFTDPKKPTYSFNFGKNTLKFSIHMICVYVTIAGLSSKPEKN